MAKQRERGHRAEILFDKIDLEILELLNLGNSNSYFYGDGISVLDLAKKLKIKHKNLKPHLDKLRYAKLVSIIRSNKDIRLISPLVYWDIVEYDDATKEDMKEIEEYKGFLKYIRQMNLYNWEKENDKLIDFDLRKVSKTGIEDKAHNIKTLKIKKK